MRQPEQDRSHGDCWWIDRRRWRQRREQRHRSFAQANQIGDTVPVVVQSSGLFHLNNFSDAVGSLLGSGVVNTLFATLTVGGANTDTTFSGLIAGVGFVTLNKTGTGVLTLSGNNTYSGKTIIDNGTLSIDGLQAANAVEANPLGTLAGTGTVGSVTAFIGRISSPEGHSPGILHTKSSTSTTTWCCTSRRKAISRVLAMTKLT